jgi:toxin YoeB
MGRALLFLPDAWDDYLYWQSQDKSILRRINQLLKDIQRGSFQGIGKPEPLKGDKSGVWSRRIDDTNRILYRVTDTAIEIVQCRNHYNDK